MVIFLQQEILQCERLCGRHISGYHSTANLFLAGSVFIELPFRLFFQGLTNNINRERLIRIHPALHLDGIFQQPATALVFHIYLGLCRIHRKDECGGCCGIGFCIYIAGAVNKDFHIYIRRIEWVLQKPIVEF